METVIIGGGIAGLYAAYLLQKRKQPFLILEKNDLGGRANARMFYGTRIAIGAGVGRKKDVLLNQLLLELHIPTKEVQTHTHYVKPPPDMKKTWQLLQKKYLNKHAALTFREFGIACLGQKLYSEFVIATGFSDYEQAGAFDTLNYYGMEDNFESWTAVLIPWDLLIQRLASVVKHIRKAEVVSIHPDGGRYQVTTKQETIYCRNIICATTIESVRSFFPHPIYREIVGQPFLRMYGKFTKVSIPIMQKYVPTTTIVAGPLQKILPIDNGVYMIVYNDNRHSRSIRTENTSENREIMCRMLKRALHMKEDVQLIAMRSFFWSIGTHYYKPHQMREAFIKEAQHPAPNIVVVGEMVSLHQGWVEGALESVEAGLVKTQ